MNKVFLLESNNKELTQGHRDDLEECNSFSHREYVFYVVCFLVLLLQRTTASQDEKNKTQQSAHSQTGHLKYSSIPKVQRTSWKRE